MNNRKTETTTMKKQRRLQKCSWVGPPRNPHEHCLRIGRNRRELGFGDNVIDVYAPIIRGLCPVEEV